MKTFPWAVAVGGRSFLGFREGTRTSILGSQGVGRVDVLVGVRTSAFKKND